MQNIASLEYPSRFQTHRNVKSQPERDWNVTRAFRPYPIGPEYLLNYLVNKENDESWRNGTSGMIRIFVPIHHKECSGIRTRNIPEARGPPVRNATSLIRLERTILFGIEQNSELYVNLTICAGRHLNKLPSSRYHSVIKGKQLS